MAYYIQGKGGCFSCFRRRRITPIHPPSPSPSPPPPPPLRRPTRFFHQNIEYIDELPNDDSWTSNETESEGEGFNPALQKLKELGYHYTKKRHSSTPFFQPPI
jgi:hypothetical protein